MIGAFWPFLLIPTFYFVLPEKPARIGNVIFIMLITPVAWITLEESIAVRFTAVLFGTSLFAVISIREINILHDLLKLQAITDALTGLYNRSSLQSSLEKAIELYRRAETPMTLLMFDIDDFKRINDGQGHQAGDVVLKTIGDYLVNNIRSTDKVFRIGGEEFLMLLNNTREINGISIAEKLCQEIAELPLTSNTRVTVSVGVCGLQENMTSDDWVKACDDNLYRAKEAGRNQVVA